MPKWFGLNQNVELYIFEGQSLLSPSCPAFPTHQLYCTNFADLLRHLPHWLRAALS